MKISVIGTGYVGLIVGGCLADMGNNVICVDNDENKLEQLRKGIMPIYEPGLEELILSNISENRLTFTSDIDYAVKESGVCYIAVGTPQGEDGSADLQYVFDVADSIGKAMNGYKVIVDKSTVPVGTADKVTEIIKNNTNHPFDVISNPEFLKQGHAVDDFLRPERIIIGSNSERATLIMQELYSTFLRSGNRVIVMDVKSAEMTKYAANSFLATKISFMNEIANLCEKVGADAEMVRIGISTDSRIGNKFLYSGIGYGGSCFPKDVKALIKTGNDFNCEMSIIKSTDEVNNNQRKIFVDKIIKKHGEDLTGKVFGVWGLSFKPRTNDMRYAPSITVIDALLNRGAIIKAYDPKAKESAEYYFKDKIQYCENAYDVLVDADSLIIMTEWNEFRRPDFEKFKSLMRGNSIFDARNLFLRKRIEDKGFEYFAIGV